MANAIKNLIGLRFKKLIVLELAHKEGGRAHWRCQCDCGNQTVVASNHLQKHNGTASCGCDRAVHGMARPGQLHPLYRVWLAMRARCSNPNNKDYKWYGGRGITVCPEWDDFTQFARDMGSRPPGRSLDRIDNDGPYSKDNCRWATKAEQMKNTSVARWIEFNGERKVLSEWARTFSVSTGKLHSLLRRRGEQEALAELLRRT